MYTSVCYIASIEDAIQLPKTRRGLRSGERGLEAAPLTLQHRLLPTAPTESPELHEATTA